MIVRAMVMIAALAAASSAAALDVEGVRLADKATVGGQELMLNGAGRTDGLKQNTTAAELSAIAVQTGEMAAIMKSFGQAKEGSVVTLDFVDGATKVGLDGTVRGSIDGATFNDALTKIWVGEHPAQDDPKKAMLGGA